MARIETHSPIRPSQSRNERLTTRPFSLVMSNKAGGGAEAPPPAFRGFGKYQASTPAVVGPPSVLPPTATMLPADHGHRMSRPHWICAFMNLVFRRSSVSM